MVILPCSFTFAHVVVTSECGGLSSNTKVRLRNKGSEFLVEHIEEP